MTAFYISELVFFTYPHYIICNQQSQVVISRMINIVRVEKTLCLWYNIFRDMYFHYLCEIRNRTGNLHFSFTK